MALRQGRQLESSRQAPVFATSSARVCRWPAQLWERSAPDSVGRNSCLTQGCEQSPGRWSSRKQVMCVCVCYKSLRDMHSFVRHFCLWIPGTGIISCYVQAFSHAELGCLQGVLLLRCSKRQKACSYFCRQSKAALSKSQCTACKPRSDQRSGSFRGSASSLSSWSSEGGCTPSGSGTSAQHCTHLSITTGRGYIWHQLHRAKNADVQRTAKAGWLNRGSPSSGSVALSQSSSRMSNSSGSPTSE